MFRRIPIWNYFKYAAEIVRVAKNRQGPTHLSYRTPVFMGIASLLMKAPGLGIASQRFERGLQKCRLVHRHCQEIFGQEILHIK